MDIARCGNWHSGEYSHMIKLNHVVATVGYGVTKDGKPYTIIRNSWGPKWGEGGYMKIAAQDGNGICGVNMISYAVETD